MERIKDVLNTKFPISFIGIVWVFAIVFGMWGYADQRFATKNDMQCFKQEYYKDIKDINDNINFLVQLHIHK